MPTPEPPLATPMDALPIAVATPLPVMRAIPIAERVDDAPHPIMAPIVPRRSLVVRVFQALVSGIEWLFGLVSLLVGLAVLAAIPVFQFLSLGYLLEATGRVARTGRFREGFIGVRTAGRIGGAIAGAWILMLPIRFVADMSYSAQILDPFGLRARAWRFGLFLLIVAVSVQIFLAMVRGARLRYFFWPFHFMWFGRTLMHGGLYSRSRDQVWDFVMSLRLPYYFALGLKGFVGAFLWLVLPVSLLAIGHAPFNAAPLVGILGAILLGIVLLYLPFLQARQAMTGRFGAIFELRRVRLGFSRAPWAYLASLLITVAFALPLYLLKIEAVPAEVTWLPSLVFILFIYPARLLTGWAVARSERRQEPRHFVFRWSARLPLLPIAGIYVLFLFLAQYTSWHGVFSLYEQHAFLLPVPFFGG